MDRSNRVTFLEPLLLILKQRTGIATILGIILAIVLHYLDFPKEAITEVVALVFVYVVGQKWVDAREASAPIVEFADKVNVEVDKVLETQKEEVVGVEVKG